MLSKKLVKNLLLVGIVVVLIGISFWLYLHFIGIPKTQARNYYNQAIISLRFGHSDKALSELNKALDYWEEDYILEKIEELENQPAKYR